MRLLVLGGTRSGKSAHAESAAAAASRAAGNAAATPATSRTPARAGDVGTRPRPEYAGTHAAGSSVQTVVVTGTSTTYRWPNSSIASWKCPALPYSSSATTQSRPITVAMDEPVPGTGGRLR